MTSPLVSVIIPCYRQGRFLASSVRSVLQQSYSPIEVIVVNDGSDDDTDTVAQSFGDQIRYFRQANAGVSAARNAGINQARGEYLHFLDADDLIHPDAIGWLVEAAKWRLNPLPFMGARRFVMDSDLASGRTTLPPQGDRLELHYLVRCLGNIHTHLCRRTSVLAAGGFDTTLSCGEDWDLWNRLVLAGAKIIPIRRVGAYYRQHPDSVTHDEFRLSMSVVEVLRRSWHRILAHSGVPARLTADPKSVVRAVQEALQENLLGIAYYFRQHNRYPQAAYCYCLYLREVGWDLHPLLCLCKLVPHKILRSMRLLAPRPESLPSRNARVA